MGQDGLLVSTTKLHFIFPRPASGFLVIAWLGIRKEWVAFLAMAMLPKMNVTGQYHKVDHLFPISGFPCGKQSPVSFYPCAIPL